MKKLIRKLVPNKVVNYGEHLPAAVLANLRYGFPSKKLTVIGVTGTDGKTTTSNMIYQILKDAGKKVSLVSTIYAVIGDKEYDTGFHVTNPSPFALQSYLKQAQKADSEYMVLEVTSHGLDQYRTWGIKFDVGVITNITSEHLDYHKTWENYFLAKAKLIKNVGVAVLNHDEEHFNRLSKLTKGKVVSFGMSKLADFNPRKFALNLKILGEFNILNAEAAAAVGVSLGIKSDDIKKTLNNFDNLAGRMEEIENNRGIKIVVDFAHTANALEQALKTLRKETKGKLISVFGAASERDTIKRPFMGEVAGKFADITILTIEDPRFEEPMKIIKEIAMGAKEVGAAEEKNLFYEPDRQKAIDLAVSMAQKGDLVGIFGKGHEKTMNIKGIETAWSDQEAVKRALNGRKD